MPQIYIPKKSKFIHLPWRAYKGPKKLESLVINMPQSCNEIVLQLLNREIPPLEFEDFANHFRSKGCVIVLKMQLDDISKKAPLSIVKEKCEQFIFRLKESNIQFEKFVASLNL